MPLITIRLDSHDQPMTVGEMRQRLARALSKLDGNTPVQFSFTARLGETITVTPHQVEAQENLLPPGPLC